MMTDFSAPIPSSPASLPELAHLIATLRAVKPMTLLLPPRLAIFLGQSPNSQVSEDAKVSGDSGDSRGFGDSQHSQKADFIDLCYRDALPQSRLCAVSGADFRLYETPPLASVQDEEMLKALAYGMMAIEGPYEVFAAALYLADDHADDHADTDINFDTMLRTRDLAFAALCGAVMAAFLAQIPMILEGAAGLKAARIIAHYNPALWDQVIICGDISAPNQAKLKENGATYWSPDYSPENLTQPPDPPPHNTPLNTPLNGYYAAQCLWHLSNSKQSLYDGAPDHGTQAPHESSIMRAAS
ncbi:MAG: hypothetical protein JNK24_07550 [Alphaproteobacteria bacterium]|nr:hypothetical protein [Alphaproteobacteria bacterium]